MKARALVLNGYGINCPYETAYAVRASGGEAEIRHVSELISDKSLLYKYNFLILPGGFSFGDDISSARVLANRLRFNLGFDLLRFVNDGKLVLGICNGFQALVKMGLLPEPDYVQRTTLTHNQSGKFEDRWITLKMNAESPCVFTRGIGTLELPVRHGEGRFIPATKEVLESLQKENLIACRYAGPGGKENPGYPYNPNGSVMGIAGICDRSGRVFGLMPHPEAYNHRTNNPKWTRGVGETGRGLEVFRNAVRYLEEKGGRA